MKMFRAYGASECGPDGYPLAWHSDIKHLVRELAGNRCIRCQHPYRCGEQGNGEWSFCDEKCTHFKGPGRHFDPTTGEYETWDNGDVEWLVSNGYKVEARWRILTVHHLDGDKRNCRWWNLAALCQRCHLRIQTTVHPAQVYPFPHSDWFKPFAAGFYAFSYLGQDLNREETEARLEELLALELVPA